jgi:hypothetical protein
VDARHNLSVVVASNSSNLPDNTCIRPGRDGTWLGRNGSYKGETLRVVTRPDGTVSHLDLASLIFTREPYEASPPIPGGIDPGGWRPG